MAHHPRGTRPDVGPGQSGPSLVPGQSGPSLVPRPHPQRKRVWLHKPNF